MWILIPCVLCSTTYMVLMFDLVCRLKTRHGAFTQVLRSWGAPKRCPSFKKISQQTASSWCFGYCQSVQVVLMLSIEEIFLNGSKCEAVCSWLVTFVKKWKSASWCLWAQDMNSGDWGVFALDVLQIVEIGVLPSKRSCKRELVDWTYWLSTSWDLRRIWRQKVYGFWLSGQVWKWPSLGSSVTWV